MSNTFIAPKTFKAPIMYGPGDIRLTEFPFPSVPEGGLIVRSLGSGVCGSDKLVYRGGVRWDDVEYTEKGCPGHDDTAFPKKLGHEMVGEIVEISEEAKARGDYDHKPLEVGDRVVVAPVTGCGECYYCRRMPWLNLCNSPERTGDCGGFGEYVAIHRRTPIFKMPEDMPSELGMIVEPMCVSYALDHAAGAGNALANEGFTFGSSVVIMGVGPIGLLHVVKARLLGASTIIVTDLSKERLEIAREFGADVLINSNELKTSRERVDRVFEVTGGIGADVVVHCAGIVDRLMGEGLSMLRKCGYFIDVSGTTHPEPRDDLNMAMVFAKSLRVAGSFEHSTPGFTQTIDMLNRTKDQFPWDKFFTHRFPMEKYQEAIDVSMGEEAMKVIVDPTMKP